MPTIFTVTSWPQRWNLLAVESLRPVESRGRFLREQGAALALDMAIVWASITAGTFAMALIFLPSALFSPAMAGILLRIAAAQVWLFAVNAWMLRYRDRRWLGFLTFVGALTTMAVLTGRAIDGPKGALNTPSPAFSAVIALIGVLIACDAYRRWLRTDLD
jgi:hypothetical protein